MDRRKFELHNISTDQILQDFKVTFKDYLKKANKEGLECGFGIAYNDAKKSWKSALCQGQAVGTPTNKMYDKLPDGYHKTAIFHVHPTLQYGACFPSGVTGTPKQDIDVANSDTHKNEFYLVGTFVPTRIPVKPVQPESLCYSLVTYSGDDQIEIMTQDQKLEKRDWQIWIVFNTAATKL